MFNLYEFSIQEPSYRQLECDGCLFVEYKCIPGEAELDDLWSQHGHIVFVTAGKKIWISPDGECFASQGEAVYCKKGASLIRNFYENDFCALIFFFPDDFIKEVVQEYQEGITLALKEQVREFHVMNVKVDETLKSFFDSVVTYFFQKGDPSKHILKLKFKELLLHLLTSGQNSPLAQYFVSLSLEQKVNLKKIMHENFLYNLSLENYAKICCRSLSTFKRDFKEAFGVSPGKWLVEQRLKHAKMLLLTSDESINEIAFHSGFETTSHFIRCFKKYFSLPPLQFRQQSHAAVK
jgi:AraC family transcriptional regulator, exoenzyme S synthesis regulatory protein ExsA